MIFWLVVQAQTDETEFRHQTEKELVSLRAKLTSLEQINTTLEDRLLTSQSHWNMERNTLNNMHLQTIKVGTRSPHRVKFA